MATHCTPLPKPTLGTTVFISRGIGCTESKAERFLRLARRQGFYFSIQARDPMLDKVRTVRTLSQRKALQWLNLMLSEGYIAPHMDWIDLRHLSHNREA